MGAVLSKRRSRSSGTEMGPYLQHNNVYKITSVEDKNVIEVDLSSEGAPAIVKKWSKGSNQKFKVSQIDSGAFQFTSLTSPNQAWDFSPANALLFQTAWNDGSNQLWCAEEIHPHSKICIIKPLNDERCLRNMGLGKQIALVQKNLRDLNMLWRIEPTR